MNSGNLVVSLDFELIWGMIEKSSNNLIKNKIKNVPVVISKILELFKEYNIHATWAIVGILLCEDNIELIEYIKAFNVNYDNSNYNVNNYINNEIKNNFDEDYHFGYDLIKQIINTKNQEIASHSFSHFYSNETGQSKEDFLMDIKLFRKILYKKFNKVAKSYIHPRFQSNEAYNQILFEEGFLVYRGIREDKLRNTKLSKGIKRKMKYIDRYFNFLGTRTFKINKVLKNGLYNIKESYYFRPYNKNKILEYFKLRRIKKEMTYSAKRKRTFHLWWHPHDFGENIELNIKQLEKILKHYSLLHKKYNYLSKNMIEVYDFNTRI